MIFKRAAPEYTNADEGRGIPAIPPFKGDSKFSWHLINSVAAVDFDLTTCQEMLVDHGFTVRCPCSGKATLMAT